MASSYGARTAADPAGARDGLPDEVRLDGIAADEGLALLGESVDRVAWLDRSAFLSASFGYPAPWLRHVAVSPLLRTAAAPGPGRGGRPRPAGRSCAVAFAPEHGDHAVRWARAHGHRLLAPDPAVTARAADKIEVLGLFGAAGVAVPEHVVVPARDRAAAAAYWRADWPAAVLQRRENNLLGQGTVRVDDARALEAALRAWPGRALRLSRLVPGRSLTVSACVGGDRTVVGAVSQQLVGLPGLTAGWGTHCGNQLLDPADLPPGTYARARAAALSVGEVLRAQGYRGVFGLDLVESQEAGGEMLGIEVNPRFQTVSSLGQAAEHAAGLLPALGLHVLACLLPELPPGRVSAARVPRLSQLVVHAERAGHARDVPAAGRYRLDAHGAAHGPDPAGPLPLPLLGADEALWWPHAAPGRVVAGDELVLLQFPAHRCALTAARPALDPAALAWRAAAARAWEGAA
ncbi:ATP-grasp domain-containing protein [Streptomyces sp. NPDC047002]|uniref:ATP-grasp domain-containing protein n=1 Tax=Streptomyces sp. NPDC047002 TaxID=3155475 RepID=UPI003456982A